MTSPEETYRAAICRALEAHLVRVKAARRTRDLAISTTKNLGEHDLMRRLTVYAEANIVYGKAIPASDAQRSKDDADALAAFKATGEVSSRSCCD
jgi:hypothetical protein